MATMLITGGHGGLGQAVVKAARADGWTVLAPTSAELDLRSAAAVDAYAQTLPNDLGAVVHLVGGIRAGSAVDTTPHDDVVAMFDLNVMTTFHVVGATMARLRTNRGCIVTIGARDVLHPQSNRAAYASSKAAVVTLTQVLAEEGRPDGVRANCIVPSIIRTEANLEWADLATAELMVTPEQIASTIVDLCRPTSAVSGAVIPMYGGFPY
ncbi:MAG: SDR family NAD(P)-dependent oxidoreductase [Candidatus Kapabacteria bacterium]|nr:SDR family NAD(P)-dependent oxidoreductase [Candidatus Kapabacteria bacterium]